MKIAIISRDEKVLAELGRLVGNRNPADDVDAHSGPLEQLYSAQELPDVLMFDRPGNDGADLAAIERLSNQFPRLAVILLCPQQSPDFLLQAMRAGVREVLPSPAAAASIYPALERIEEKLERRDNGNGKVLAFISCKGGSGATFIATNLGYALAASGHKRVALLDLNLHFGDASLFVSESKPLATLADVTRDIHRLDPSFLASSMLNVLPISASWRHRKTRPTPAKCCPNISTPSSNWRGASMISWCSTWGATSMRSACARSTTRT